MAKKITWTDELVRRYTPLFLVLGYEKDKRYGFCSTHKGVFVECEPYTVGPFVEANTCATDTGIYISKERIDTISLEQADVLMALLLGSNMGET